MPNVRRQVVPGDIWEYNDPDDGGWVRWRVDEVSTETGTLRKLTGKDIGYPARDYPIVRMSDSPLWRWCEGKAEAEVIFACPHCGKDRPIPEGDYVCVECRQKLDG